MEKNYTAFFVVFAKDKCRVSALTFQKSVEAVKANPEGFDSEIKFYRRKWDKLDLVRDIFLRDNKDNKKIDS